LTAEPISTAVVPVVHRWRRYGQDRAYVKVGDEDLGYRDLKSGSVHCERPGDEELVAHATADLFRRVSAARTASEYQPRHSRDDDEQTPSQPPSTTASPPDDLLPDRDLAQNGPGESARQQSRVLLKQGPVKLLIARAIGVKTE
jgi:hypothetical protein